MRSTIQSSKTTQKLLTKLKKIGALFAGSMISLMPATALGNNPLPAPDLFDDFGILLWSDTSTPNLFDDVVVTAVRDRMIDNVKVS